MPNRSSSRTRWKRGHSQLTVMRDRWDGAVANDSELSVWVERDGYLD
jgi:hypothetical protein